MYQLGRIMQGASLERRKGLVDALQTRADGAQTHRTQTLVHPCAHPASHQQVTVGNHGKHIRLLIMVMVVCMLMLTIMVMVVMPTMTAALLARLP